VGRTAGALFKESAAPPDASTSRTGASGSGGAEGSAGAGEGGGARKRRGDAAAGQLPGALKRFHALRVKLGGEKGVVGEPELAEDWAVPMSPLDAELLRASGPRPLRALSAVAEQQRQGAPQSAGARPLTPSVGSAPSVASTPKGGDKPRKGARRGRSTWCRRARSSGLGPPG